MAFNLELYRKSNSYKFINIRDLIAILHNSNNIDKSFNGIKKMISLIPEIDKVKKFSNREEIKYLTILLNSAYINTCLIQLNYDITSGQNLTKIIKRIKNDKNSKK